MMDKAVEEDRGFDSPCLIWTGGTNNGYGWINSEREGAHRVAWRAANGAIPADQHVHHRCGQRLCVRVEHLMLITPADHRYLHGPRRKNRLSAEQVEDIRTSPLTLEAVALKHGISKSYASKVRLGRAPKESIVEPEALTRPPTPHVSWNRGKTKLSAAAVREIRQSPLSLRKVAAKHGITATYASQIRRGLILGHL